MATSERPNASTTTDHVLTNREREILRLVVTSFIDKAGPVGSRFLARSSGIGLSPASIRNTMSDLEEYGYLDQPYTSAGRVPTEFGYRTFVDELMGSPRLSKFEKMTLQAELDRLIGNTEELFKESSRLLGRFSSLLGVVLAPKLSSGILERMEVVQLSSSRIMFVVSVKGGLVKTIVLELESDLNRRDLDRVVRILNERLAGLSLEEIRRTYPARVRDLRDDGNGIVRLVLNEGALLFSDPAETRRLQYAGTQNILLQPEFQEASDLRNLIEMLEDEDYVVHMLEDRRASEDEAGHATIRIGRENNQEKVERYSIVTAPYKIGRAVGTVGVIGPMRMDYERIIALVENIATLLSRQDKDRSAPQN
ncbi:MAG: heat-inducible transcriptional repressor HrcA [Rhodothermales bacterium]